MKRRKWCITEEGKGEMEFAYDLFFIFDDFCPAAFGITYTRFVSWEVEMVSWMAF